MHHSTIEHWNVHWYGEVTSTMDVARGKLEEVSAGSPLVVVAERQTAGRGRQGRSWFSEEGALAATFVLGGQVPAAHLSGFSLAVGTVLRDVCRELGGTVLLKWPNDVLTTEGRKVAGVLIELVTRSGHTYVLVGIGMNLTSAPAAVEMSAALGHILGKDVSVDEILPLVCRGLWKSWETFIRQGFSAFRESWLASAHGLGQHVTLDVGKRVVEGTMRGVDANGQLLLETDRGVEHIASGHHL